MYVYGWHYGGGISKCTYMGGIIEGHIQMYVHGWNYRGGISKCTYTAGIMEGAYTNIRV